jgi:ankyrin repeat protein
MTFLTFQDEHGNGPLHRATFGGYNRVTELLVAARCDVDLERNDGYTAMHLTAQEGHAPIIKQLIDAHCNVNSQAGDGCTPLHLAAKGGHAVITKQLIAALCNGPAGLAAADGTRDSST